MMNSNTGTLIRWDDSRNFGWIRDDFAVTDESGKVKDLFIHVSGFKSKLHSVKGTRLTYNIGMRQGKPIAVDAEPIVAPVSGARQ
jgi:cold shock CspA family protein